VIHSVKDLLLNLLAGWGLEQPLNRRRGIDDNPRVSVSFGTRRAAANSTLSGLRVCRRLRNSVNVGLSAISLISVRDNPIMTCRPLLHELSTYDEAGRVHVEAESASTCY
jgi:hypothetical protein